MGLYDLTLHAVIRRNAQCYQSRTAWLEENENQALSFEQYKQEVDRMAAGIASAGVRKGDRIGVIGKNCLPYYVLYGAAAALGAILVPVNWRLSATEMVYILNDSEARVVFADNDDPETVTAVRAGLADQVAFYNLQPTAGPWAELPETDVPGSGLPQEDVSSEDGLVIIYTAAVSGHPRGALLSHGNLLSANIQMMHLLGLTADDVHLNPLPLFHIAGLGMAFCAFHAGVKTVNMPKFDAARAARLIAAHKVTLLFAFAPMMQTLLAHVEQSGDDIRSLRAVLGIDTPEVIARYQDLTGGNFFSMFGQTETSLVATLSRYNDRPGSAGRPIPLVDIQLMDDEDRPVPVGQPGEIAIRGPMVFQGYWRLASENAHTFRNGWHHTGDLGRFDNDGYLWYVARKAEKELIKPGGENVYPAEVETVILAHPAVDAVVVFGVPDPKWTEGIKAVCRLLPGHNLTSEELIAFVGARIARYKKPQYVAFVSELPLAFDGTVDRAKVKQLHGGHQGDRS
ncbi:MAG: AMP-binding protein [Desulfatitalea sp.]|nr:AMP-binding protein [Desulfatitalea sp.]